MATTRTSSAGKVSFGSWESEKREHPQGCSLFARPQGAEILQPERAAFLFLPHCAGVRIKGDILFLEREYPPYTPKRKDEGSPPRPPTLAVCSLNSCTRCAIRCGVHGFAMNPCESLRLATAPYYREARVTFAWRRTACGMRHCFARRIVETGGRRELLRTSTRWAERHPQGVCRIRKASEPPTAAQQRIIGVSQIV